MATNVNQDDYLKTALRLPRPLHSSVLAAAAESGRSMNAEIIDRLQRSFDTKPSAELNLLLARTEYERAKAMQSLVSADLRYAFLGMLFRRLRLALGEAASRELLGDEKVDETEKRIDSALADVDDHGTVQGTIAAASAAMMKMHEAEIALHREINEERNRALGVSHLLLRKDDA